MRVLGRPVRMLGVLLAAVVALCCATAGIASAETSTEPAGSINLGVDEPTTTISVDGGVVELIPATSYELPSESTALPSNITVRGASSEVASTSGAESQGVSSSTGPTSSAGVGGSVSVTWFVVGVLAILGAVAALWLARSRRAAH
jgi:cobalamin biosynthesis Mg chelatase CobN